MTLDVIIVGKTWEMEQGKASVPLSGGVAHVNRCCFAA